MSYPCVTVNGVIKYQHVAVAEAAIGRPLPKGAVVHHVDGDPRNNQPSNLVICQDQNYHMLLHYRAKVLAAGGDPNTDRLCTDCKRPRSTNWFYQRKNRKYRTVCITCQAEQKRRIYYSGRELPGEAA